MEVMAGSRARAQILSLLPSLLQITAFSQFRQSQRVPRLLLTP